MSIGFVMYYVQPTTASMSNINFYILPGAQSFNADIGRKAR